MSVTLDELCINTIRFLSIDAVEKAKSGHPGTPMGAATIAYALWARFLKHNPGDPHWINRDRFILSAGHASMLLYSLLYLTGYNLSLEDIKEFRQYGSKAPGHPEYGITPGVETTTGPLGQGFANGVGMAIAERWLAQRFNRPDFDIIDHFIYALVSDGDLQEGVSSEAASIAGNLHLGKLIYLYDSNDVQQDGPTESFTENVAQRFQAYGWNVIGPVNGMDLDAVSRAIEIARSQPVSPTLIICKTIIGYGSPNKAGAHVAHGEPLGQEEVRLTRDNLKWEYEEPFSIPEQSLKHFRQALERGKDQQQNWEHLFEEYRKEYPHEAERLENEVRGDLPPGWDAGLPDLFIGTGSQLSTRDASGKVINYIASRIPAFMGGAADVAGSTRTSLKEFGIFRSDNYAGRNLQYGLREHAMGAISNGIALTEGVIPFTGTFLIFSDYMRPPMRLAAMMKLRIIYVFTHDSIGLGEDGPTHQPIEILMGMRMLPNLLVVRPADTLETAEAWKIALERRDGPSSIILTRQKVPVLDRSIMAAASGMKRGGYVLWESGLSPRVILIGTGSEVHIAIEAGRILQGKGISARVVSLPCWSLFDSQPAEYRNSVLLPEIRARVSIEAGTPLGWERYVGMDGKAIGINYFGVSAPGDLIYKQFELTPQKMADEALKLL
jgi:transketolase